MKFSCFQSCLFVSTGSYLFSIHDLEMMSFAGIDAFSSWDLFRNFIFASMALPEGLFMGWSCRVLLLDLSTDALSWSSSSGFKVDPSEIIKL